MNSFSETNNNDDKTESDSVTALELQKTRRVLYFSDGIMEELSESEGDDIEPDATDKCSNPGIIVDDPSRSRLKSQFQEIGHRFICGIDYVGESLASFLGITSPKYLSASDIENIRTDMHQSQNVKK
ncbi:hypothetical protein DOY81_008771 [Sarcophaga bullata]|nr:hypothetical protein DOY81_008771 [Sarcophaga bullata]